MNPDFVWVVAAFVIFCLIMYVMFRMDDAKVARTEARFRAKFPDCCYPNAQNPAHHLHYRVVSVPSADCVADPPTMSSVGLTWCCKCSYKLSQAPHLYPTERINA